MISLATTAFKAAQLGSGTRVDLDADVIKTRIGSNSDLSVAAPNFTDMTGIPKYLGSTDQVCASPSIVTTVGGGFDAASIVAFDCNDQTFPAIAADAGKSIDWLCFFKFVTNDAGSIPLFFITGFTPIVPASSPITVQFSGTTTRIYALVV